MGETVNRPLKANKKLKETWNHKKDNPLTIYKTTTGCVGGEHLGELIPKSTILLASDKLDEKRGETPLHGM